MSRRVIVVLFGTLLVGAIWAARPIINLQTIPVVSSARAQTKADPQAAFTAPLTEVPSLKSLRTRQTVYVAAYSTVRLGAAKARSTLPPH
jgi:hypothetical protein